MADQSVHILNTPQIKTRATLPNHNRIIARIIITIIIGSIGPERIAETGRRRIVFSALRAAVYSVICYWGRGWAH